MRFLEIYNVQLSAQTIQMISQKIKNILLSAKNTQITSLKYAMFNYPQIIQKSYLNNIR